MCKLPMARFPHGLSLLPAAIAGCRSCRGGQDLRWSGCSFRGLPECAAISGPGHAGGRCRQQRHRRRSGGEGPNRFGLRCVRRRTSCDATPRFPYPTGGIAVHRPVAIARSTVRVLRRATIPDLSDRGLRPHRALLAVPRTATVPIIDVGFVDAVRRGMIEVVPAVTALDRRAVVLADGSRVFPDAIVAAGLPPRTGAARRGCHGDRGARHPEAAAAPSLPWNRHPAIGTPLPDRQGRSANRR